MNDGEHEAKRDVESQTSKADTTPWYKSIYLTALLIAAILLITAGLIALHYTHISTIQARNETIQLRNDEILHAQQVRNSDQQTMRALHSAAAQARGPGAGRSSAIFEVSGQIFEVSSGSNDGTLHLLLVVDPDAVAFDTAFNTVENLNRARGSLAVSADGLSATNNNNGYFLNAVVVAGATEASFRLVGDAYIGVVPEASATAYPWDEGVAQGVTYNNTYDGHINTYNGAPGGHARFGEFEHRLPQDGVVTVRLADGQVRYTLYDTLDAFNRGIPNPVQPEPVPHNLEGSLRLMARLERGATATIVRREQ